MADKRTSGEILTWGLGVTALFYAIVMPWWSYPTEILTKKIELLGRFHGHHAPGWLLVASIIIFGTVVPYSCVMAGIIYTTASTGSVIGMLEPVIAGRAGRLGCGVPEISGIRRRESRGRESMETGSGFEKTFGEAT